MNHNIALWPEASETPETITYWLNDLYKDETIVAITNSKAFLRLKDISFLGALDYTHEGSDKIKKQDRSRAGHSLYVAALANYISNLRHYPAELKRHLIIAGLLHDIGHAPLSHSAEPYIKKAIGYGHHEAGEQIIQGKVPIGRELYKLLRQHVDLELIVRLIDATASTEDGGDLFSSPLNIDTIDGIIRSHAYLTGFRSTQCRLSIAKAAFGESLPSRLNILDSFWDMKHRVYSNLINNEYSLISDKASEFFFYEQSDFKENEIYCSERSWQQRHKALFQSFNSLMKERLKPSWVNETNVAFTYREYYLNRDKTDHSRFACLKEKRLRKLDLQSKNHKNFKQIEFNKF